MLAAITSSTPATAQPARATDEGATAATGGDELHWQEHWRRVGTWEYVTSPALGLTALGVALLVEPPSSGRWTGPILFDDAARRGLRLGSRSGRVGADTASHVLLTWSIAHPALIDSLLVAWWARHSPDVAWQMFWIDAHAYALTGAMVVTTKLLTGRERPWADRCPEVDGEVDCAGDQRYLSFPSSHAAFSATGAGLVCAHHAELDLYGDAALDAGACVLTVTAAAATGMLRIAADSHYASDVVTGQLVGFLSGYLLPSLFYYPAPAALRRSRVAVVPMLQPDGARLTASGIF